MLGQKDKVSLDDPFPTRGTSQATQKKKKNKKSRQQIEEPPEEEEDVDFPSLSSLSKKRMNKNFNLLQDIDDESEEVISSRRAAPAPSQEDGEQKDVDQDYQGDSDISDGPDVDPMVSTYFSIIIHCVCIYSSMKIQKKYLVHSLHLKNTAQVQLQSLSFLLLV